MPQFTLAEKREIVERLGYELRPRDGTERAELFDPEGKHRGCFRPCRATDQWAWNDAVFQYELYQDRDGVVHKKVGETGGREAAQVRHLHVWPETDPKDAEPRETSRADFEAAGAYLRIS